MGQSVAVKNPKASGQLDDRMAALTADARSAVALSVARRLLPALCVYLSAVGRDPEQPRALVGQAWASLYGGVPPTPDQLAALFESAPPAPRDVPSEAQREARMASEAFLALAAAVHCTIHHQVREAVSVLEDARYAALDRGGEAAVVEERQLQDAAITLAESVGDYRELLHLLKPAEQNDEGRDASS